MEKSWPGLCLHVEGKYSWLSISSYHSFILDNVVWPSVLHYMSAKRFEGTSFEEEIRGCKSIDMLVSLTKPRYIIETDTSGTPYKIEVYGKTKNYRIRADWKMVYLSYLEEANRAKFSNHNLAEKLLQTGTMKIIDKNTPQNGVCLEKIRAELSKPRQLEISINLEKLYQNLKERAISDREIDVILDMFRYIRRMEGCKIYYSEMMEDVIENIVGPDKIKEIVKYSKAIVWNDVPPHMEMLIKNLKVKISHLTSANRKLTAEVTSGEGLNIDETHLFQTSLLLASFFGLTTSAIFPKKEDIKLPPKARWYRRSVAISKKKSISVDKSINTFHDW